ncbi:hypothetical protein Taro_025979, partial [Colocasia esculenta]|nr:hypothetical protein [Colocasia esculenta]
QTRSPYLIPSRGIDVEKLGSRLACKAEKAPLSRSATMHTLSLVAAGSFTRVICGPRRGKGGSRRNSSRDGVGFGGGSRRSGGDGAETAAPRQPTWRCAQGCGACCKLDKGPAFPSPHEIFSEDPPSAELYESMIGPDGWCIHYEHSTRTCSIYAERPYFCRVEPGVFEKLFGIEEKRFNSEACRSCRDTIKAVYGSQSKELKNFNSTLSSRPSAG